MKLLKLRPVTDAAFALLIALIIAVGCIRIGLTYDVFWQTWDEPFHLAAGMEWLEDGQYTYEPLHPPLARVMAALGPYLSGVRGIDALISPWDEGSAMLHAGGTYERTLTLARLGILPFFVGGAVVVATWAHHLGGKAVAVLATVLFTTLPPVLAHGGFATLDMACAALVAAALFAFSLWLEHPTLGRSAGLGIALGLALLAKFSALGFLVVALGLVGIAYGLDRLRPPPASPPRGMARVDARKMRRWAVGLTVATACFALTIWSGYRFSLASLASLSPAPDRAIERVLGSVGLVSRGVYWVIDRVPLPAPEFAVGVRSIFYRDQQGHLAYFLGDVRREGWWYFYPLLLAVKTPLSLLLLGAVGGGLAVRQSWRTPDRLKPLMPVIAALAILTVGMLSSVNNGVRQILSIYPLLAVVAGYGAERLLSLRAGRWRLIARGAVTILLAWQLGISFASHPDYVAYFNELAGGQPEDIAVVGDLDWGQDLKRLAQTLERRGIEDVAVLYNGSRGIDLSKFGLPVSKSLEPYRPTTGWVAVSIYYLKLGTRAAPYDQFDWLKAYQPVERVGKTILLYYIPEGSISKGSIPEDPTSRVAQ